MNPKSLQLKKTVANRSVCLWAQANVVRLKTCRRDFECSPCPFDRAMRRAAEQSRSGKEVHGSQTGRKRRPVYWKERLNTRPPGKRPCIHHMKGRIEFRACNHAYHCHDCEFDQYFTDQLGVHATVRPVHVLEIDGFKIPQGYYLHRGHSWVRVEEGGEVRVGMDDFIHRVMGPFDRIVLPLVGKPLRRNEPDVTVERGPHRAHLRSPVTGVITTINTPMMRDGRPASQDPYADGWIMRIHVDDIRQDMKHLMLGAETADFYQDENIALNDMIEAEAGPMVTDGGFPAGDLLGCMPSLGWNRLADRFLRN